MYIYHLLTAFLGEAILCPFWSHLVSGCPLDFLFVKSLLYEWLTQLAFFFFFFFFFCMPHDPITFILMSIILLFQGQFLYHPLWFDLCKKFSLWSWSNPSQIHSVLCRLPLSNSKFLPHIWLQGLWVECMRVMNLDCLWNICFYGCFFFFFFQVYQMLKKLKLSFSYIRWASWCYWSQYIDEIYLVLWNSSLKISAPAWARFYE